jgi:hypothetical protein
MAAAAEVPVLDFVAAAITLTGALSILQFFDELAKRDLLEKVNLVSASEKLHQDFGICCSTVFLVCHTA